MHTVRRIRQNQKSSMAACSQDWSPAGLPRSEEGRRGAGRSLQPGLKPCGSAPVRGWEEGCWEQLLRGLDSSGVLSDIRKTLHPIRMLHSATHPSALMQTSVLICPCMGIQGNGVFMTKVKDGSLIMAMDW